MATSASRLVQDQNLNIHSTGGALLGGKIDISKAAKKGVLSGRKALNDISNSGKPSALQASKKHNSINVIPVAKDIGGSKIAKAVGGKLNLTNATEKGHSRKALGDLTNSVKPSLHKHLSGKVEEKKLNVTAEETIPIAIKEEGFMHNHQKCIETQRKGMNFGYFLETIGLGSPVVVPQQPLKLKPESPVKHLEMEEIPVVFLSDQDKKTRFSEPDCSSPKSVSPKSVKSAFEFWMDEENLFEFKLIESPKSQKQ